MDLKIKDVAELLNVSETTIRRWLSDGKIPAYRINHQYRFSRFEIESWMMQCKLKMQEAELSPFEETQIYPPVEAEKEPQEPPSRGGMHHFCLYRAVHQGDVFPNVPGKTKEELIRWTTKAAAQKLSVDDDVLAELLLDREELMPTALNNGIAVPHTRDFLRKGPLDMVFIVYPQDPLDYGALDGKLVHTLFFLFASNDKGHLQLLAKIAHLADDPKALEFLMRKPDKKAVLDYIRVWEGHVRPVT